MKKLILISSLLAATTLAANATVVSYDNLFNQADWETGAGRTGRGNFVISAGSASLTNSNWSQSYASYTFAKALELSSGEELNFKFDLNVQNLNGSFTLSLIGSTSDSGTIMIGKDYSDGTTYGNKLVYAKTDDVSKKSYQLKEGATSLMGKIDSATQVGSATFTANTTLTVSGIISKVGENYSLKLVSSDYTATVNLGTSFDLKRIGLYGDGANNTNNATFSNLSISIIPEPSAFGLLAGLGALALVGARRRRKTK